MNVWTDSTIAAWMPPLDSISIKPSLAAVIDEGICLKMPTINWKNKPWDFTVTHLQVVSRFRERTSLTIGNTQMAPLYRDLVCQLACQVMPNSPLIFFSIADDVKHPFLMHMLLSVTLMHDSHLENPSAGGTTTNSSQAALEHWNVASELFNSVLSKPIPPSYRDAIWATGVFLGAASFWSIGSTNPYKVWPLKSPEPDDLSWLRIGEGKKHLWRLAQPLRSDSIFSGLVKDHSCLTVPQWAAMETPLDSASCLAARVLKILGIDTLSEDSSNVYSLPVLALAKCPNVKLTQENALKFLYVMAVITPEFCELLEVKDMKAIFIMGWWYILLTTGDLWWMSRRARIEGEAIRIWLRRRSEGIPLANLLDEIELYARGDDVATGWFFEARAYK